MDNTVKIEIVRDIDNKKFTIGNQHGSDWRFLKNGLEGFGDVTNTITYTDNATTDGGIVSDTHVSKVDRTIQCAYMHPDTNDVARRDAIAFFNVKSTFRIYVTYSGRTVWADGYLIKLSAGMTANVKDRLDIMVTFTFPDPYWKSFDDFGKDIAARSGMIAFPYLCSMDNGPLGTTGGIFSFARIITIYNDGDVETRCRAVIKATGDVENPKLIINDEYVRLIDNLVKDDIIEIDFTASPPTVRKNGVNHIGHCDRTSAFDGMIIERGDNLVECDADNGTENMSVSIYYNKRYEAI